MGGMWSGKSRGSPSTEEARSVQAARKQLGMESNVVNYAVVGRTGVGKSSLINGLRLLPDNHPDAAKVGEHETSMETMKYKHPRHPHVVLWDIPGAGSFKYPEATYFEDTKLFAYDCILIVSTDRFHAIEYKIAEKATAWRIPFAFVRTKADVSCKSLAHRMEMNMVEVVKVFRETVVKSFNEDPSVASQRNNQFFKDLFIVSAWGFDKRRHPYTLFNSEDGSIDQTLNGMDEDALMNFLATNTKKGMGDPHLAT